MSEPTLQRMILRKEGAEGLSVKESAEHLGQAGAVILERNPGSLLIEGEEAAIKRAVQAMPGWKALPIKHYSVPDTKMRIEN